MKILLVLSFIGVFRTPSENFKKLLCDYNLKELSIKLSKKELIKLDFGRKAVQKK